MGKGRGGSKTLVKMGNPCRDLILKSGPWTKVCMYVSRIDNNRIVNFTGPVSYRRVVFNLEQRLAVAVSQTLVT